ncbi:beta-galactosidase [Salinimicrobium catena]|uniref:Beta-galactosidase n=1 Tax=Salinimicrobium catena TaxID=390640 RepID=A0A1H5LCK1_9FLAO|nr:glycoside hydrolase family 2 TIM barrel-domain containing protein [Salinimicrobium catena]SDL08502.1 beta-galactosidase [Salinimicrobium catena]SEE74769.1 beta-galactosidase [Salinimicrobium catena]
MDRSVKLWVLACLSFIFFGCESLYRAENGLDQQDYQRVTQNFGSDWQFQRLKDSAAAEAAWERVFIPHTVKIEPLVVNDQWQGISLYRKDFEVQKPAAEKWFFQFEGVMQEARVKINDSLVKVHKGGYLPFTVDATDHLINNAVNQIEVEVRNVDNSVIPPGKPLKDLDFNYYGGIYRDVFLVKTHPLHITNAVHAEKVNSGGILIHFDEVAKAGAKGFVKTHVQNDSEEKGKISLVTEFRSPGGRTYSFISDPVSIKPGEDKSIEQKVNIEEPELWSPDTPHLYQIRVQVLEDENVIDSRQVTTGIRKIELTAEGFYLNGEKLFLNGTNRHQEYPYVGYAISNEANYRDAYKIKDAGFNFVRLSHYPQDPAFLQACDELGLLVMNAIPGWQYYEEGEFVENALQDIKDMARRDRNHPSVVFWENSLNESAMTEEFMIRANQVLKEELPYPDTFSAGWIDHPSYDLFIPARQHSQPPAYWNEYDKPNRPILIAEYGDWEYYAQNAGFNQKAFEDLQEEERTSRQLRGYGEKRLLQQALNFQEAANSNLKGAQTIGMANWLMFDYNRGYADNLEASGIADIFRIPKISYYFYQSQKEPAGDPFSEAMVFIANYWQPDSAKKITVFSNAQEVALYLNNKLIEKKLPERDQFSSELAHPPFYFEVPEFEPGQLRAVGYIDGQEVASHSIFTPGEPAKIELSVDLSGKPISRRSPDVVFVYAKVLDKDGNPVPSATPQVRFTVRTANQNTVLVGENPVQAEAGIASILLRTKEFEGPVVIEAEAEGLQKNTITLN